MRKIERQCFIFSDSFYVIQCIFSKEKETRRVFLNYDHAIFLIVNTFYKVSYNSNILH